jgi:hypothetical protein
VTKRVFAKRRNGSRGFVAFIVILVIAFVGITVGVTWHRDSDYALVMATTQDCRRAFDDATCRTIADRAREIHAGSAPRYTDERVCEMTYGAGGCVPVAVLNASFYAPQMAAVAMARDSGGDAKSIVPLHFGPLDVLEAQRMDGRRVYYHGLAVGVLRQPRIGGAGVSMLIDLSGKPVTSDAVKRLRRS